MITTQCTFVETRTAGPDDAGWRFEAPSGPGRASDADPPPIRRLPSLSWRLRH
jgi:hypothetical protein